MKNIGIAFLASLATSLATLPLTAQEAKEAKDAKDGAAQVSRLHKALTRMTELKSVAFESKETGSSDMVRIAGAKPPAIEVSGKQANGLLHATCLGDQELLLGGRRMLARGDGESWRLRAGKTANGHTLPFVFDPLAFFAALKDMKLEVKHAEVGAWKDRPIETFSVTIEGDAARELAWGGLVPEANALTSFMVMRVAGGVGGAPPPPQPSLTIDVAFFVDPASDLVQRVRIRVVDASQNAMMGRVVFAAGAGGVAVGEEEEEEDEEADEKKAAPPTYKDGLPVRKKKAKNKGAETTAALELEFSQFDRAALPELSEQARVLLGR